MKYKIKIIAVDESQEDWEYYVDFMFLESHVRYQAQLVGSGYSKILRSLLGKAITADLTLENTRCKQNKEKKNSWLNSKIDPILNFTKDNWLNPTDIEETKEISCVYLCSGKILGVVRDEFECEYYRLQSEHNIDVDTDLMCCKDDDIEPENIQIGEYYSFRGALRINSIDEVEELYKNKD